MAPHFLLQHQSSRPVPMHRDAEMPRQQPQPEIPGVTPESIAAAKAAQRADRQRVTDQTGLVITDDGHIAPADDVLIGMQIANWTWWAINGSQGQR